MAVYPCDWSGHRYPGPQESLYVTSVWGQDIETFKLRLCEKHMVQLIEVSQARLAMIDEDSQVGSTCEGCNGQKAGAIYVKIFQRGKEPTTWAADFCASCWQAVRGELKVASGRPLQAR